MIKDIHIFRPGTQTSAQGVTREFTKADLQQVADSYEPEVHEAPIRIGHTDNDKVPAWGWVKNVKMKGDDLYAEVEFSPLMEDYVKNGLYKKVSASFYSPESKINPEPGKWSLRHVAMLGAQPPAVKGLSGFAYSELSDGEGILDFAVAEKLTPDQIFDEELGPTLKSDQGPLEMLKDKLEEARSEMAKEEQDKQELEAQAQQPEADQGQPEFAEDKKKAPAGEQGAEDAEEEVGEGEVEAEEPKAKKKAADEAPFEEKGPDVMEAEEGTERSENVKKAKKEMAFSEVEVPAGYDVDEYRQGFEEAVLAYREAELTGGDIEYSEEEALSPSYDAGVRAGFEFAEVGFLKNGKIAGAGSGKHDAKASPNDEEVDGEGPEASKVKKSPKDGENEVDDAGEYQEPTFDPSNKKGATKKRGSDNLNSSDVGVKETAEFKDKDGDGKNDVDYDGDGKVESGSKEFLDSRDKAIKKAMKEDENKNSELEEDEALHKESLPKKVTVRVTKPKHGADGLKGRQKSTREAQNDQSGRAETGKADEAGKTFRSRKGKTSAAEGTGTDRDAKGSDGGAQERDRATISKNGEQDADRKNLGKADKLDNRGKAVSLGGKAGSGAQVKGKGIRVMYVGKKGGSKEVTANFAETAEFSELTERLAQLEAANAKLVAEKAAAEALAHRMQLEEFAESLYATGRLTEAVMAQEDLVDYMEGLENGTLEFAEGETAATKMMDLLAALPAQVSFAEVAGGATPEEVRFEDLTPHEQALKLAKEEGLDYAEALKKSLFTAN